MKKRVKCKINSETAFCSLLVGKGEDLVLRKEEDFVCSTFNAGFISKRQEGETTYMAELLLRSLANTQTHFNTYTHWLFQAYKIKKR